jgi:hypothetical protein
MIHLLLARAGLLFAAHGLKIGLAVGLLAMVATWDRGRLRQAEQRGMQTERASVEKRGEANARKADDARRGVERLPDDKLRDRHFRD